MKLLFSSGLLKDTLGHMLHPVRSDSKTHPFSSTIPLVFKRLFLKRIF